jgi:6-phosphogluconolactonase
MGKASMMLALLVACSSGGEGGGAATAESGGGRGGGSGGGGGTMSRAGGAQPPDAASENGGSGAPDARESDDASPGADTAADLAAPDAPAPADAPALPTGNPFVYVGSNLGSEIRIFQLDMQTGALMPRGNAPAGMSPNYLAFHPSRKYLYALNEVNPGRVLAFSVNPTNGALTQLNSASSGGEGPAHLSVHKSGKWVLTANYDSGHAAALRIMDDGRVAEPMQPVRAGAMAHMILDDGASGRFVFVPSKGDHRTLQYKFDEATGRLEPNTPAFVTHVGPARHMAFHRSGRYAYVLTESMEGGRTVISYAYDAATGLLSNPVSLEAAPMGNGAHILMHPTRDLLYACLRGYDSVALFTIDAQGRAEPPRHFRQQIALPWDFSIDATGQMMAVANNANATIRVLRIDPQTGALSLAGNGASVAGQPRFVGILYPP